ncbi:rhomboid family protein [Bacillus methanolicus]|uniref:Serine protease of Rhomboid family n=1 Tax=Bacillus methanolicus (strain MGA3 / ATCC 53907) TaxID=796606 RepID=I3EAH1_BACMM|nr:rhomboid family intramembrane serine protease [Bacillus methanolicus]AIE60732.1 serine protease of Rhomboid family [Bacillus methanolicus MGA3]EIJ83492.1 Serine protease of Rhomboid family [Bacillus methanolicus MGA3]UQD52743.1 rhomboid family intramembrane serine protease [Bacillus methanolicus]
MSFREDFLFWRLAHFLISNQQYRIIQLSADQKELWLEKLENKQAQIIRMLRYDVDWSNWMQRDIELTALNGERIRKQLGLRHLSVVNVYVTPYPPVDDYQFRIEKPFTIPQTDRTSVMTFLIEKNNTVNVLQNLEHYFSKSLSFDLKDDYSESDIEAVKASALQAAKEHMNAEKAVFNNGKPFFTYVFMILQIAVFLLLELNGGSTNTSTLIRFGAKFNPLINEGEWWRFFTPIFLHIGLLHLLMNTLALYYLGTVVERIYGNVRFMLIYLAAGFAGSLASFVFSPSLSAGASGAIFGCFGALLYFGVIHPRLFFRTMGMNILVVLGINLALGFTLPGIDNAGHIGGLIGGFLAAGVLHFPRKKKILFQGLSLVLAFFIATSLLKYGYKEAAQNVDEQSVLVLAQEYIQSKNYDKAYELLNNYAKENKPSANLYFLLSYTEIKRGNVTDAKEHLQKAIKMKPDFHEAHFNLALIYYHENNIEAARIHAEKAARIKPDQKEYKDLLRKINGSGESAGET